MDILIRTGAQFKERNGVPLVKTPRVVDFPLSTFPTTAHLTSGVRDTFGGGRRSSIDVRG